MIVDKKCPDRHGSLLSAPRRIRSRLSAAHGPDKRTCPRKQVGVPRPAHRDARSAIAITHRSAQLPPKRARGAPGHPPPRTPAIRSEEHTSELQSLMRHTYAVFCLKKKKTQSS